MKSQYSPLRFSRWKRKALNTHINTDGVFGAQCVDVPKDYSEKVLYPNLSWKQVGLYGNGKDIYANANPLYFTKIRKATVQRGDIVCWGATKTNKYGHTAVVTSRRIFNRNSFTVIEQNGFNPSGKAYEVKRDYTNLVGIVRHK